LKHSPQRAADPSRKATRGRSVPLKNTRHERPSAFPSKNRMRSQLLQSPAYALQPAGLLFLFGTFFLFTVFYYLQSNVVWHIGSVATLVMNEDHTVCVRIPLFYC
jgi:hypothetical protein